MNQHVGLTVGAVVQIAPDESTKQPFHGKLAFVDEIKSWGCVLRVESFLSDGRTGNAYIRLEWGKFEYIGAPAFMPIEINTEETSNDTPEARGLDPGEDPPLAAG